MPDESQRIKQLKLRVWGHAANNMLHERKNPRLIEISKIEDHRGRRNKAIRLLGDTVTRTAGREVYRAEKLDESKSYAKQAKFCNTWQEFHDLIYFGLHHSLDEDSLEYIGYEPVSSLPKSGTLHVYWNREQYSEMKNKDLLYVYPEALLERRKKMILKAIVERHFQKNFTSNLERYLELPEESLKKDPTTGFTIRNFSAYAANFSREKLEGKDGYIEECEHYLRYFKALRYKMQKMKELIEKKGGYEYIVEEMRKDSMQQILKEAPLHIGYDPKSDSKYNYSTLAREKRTMKKASKYVLSHGSYFDYDILYADDTSVCHIDGDKALNTTYTDYNLFEADPDELKFIAKTEEEQRNIHHETLRRL